MHYADTYQVCNMLTQGNFAFTAVLLFSECRTLNLLELDAGLQRLFCTLWTFWSLWNMDILKLQRPFNFWSFFDVERLCCSCL